ncbi:MAG: response regulator [Candidatus Cloacimonetes bacterium]|jgi:CheY-like chemotaxis protein|nr:response regulator [Candidatus Cloacimonadota bacterium]MBT4332061.1 response regulator [Candidatus Cloacimonadota bacterium]
MRDKYRILIAEDELLVAQQLQMGLESLGYDVCDSVFCGEDAIVKAEENFPDLIIMDINLAGMIDGIEAAKEITENLQIPIVFMTSYSDIKFLFRAVHLKKVQYLEKPLIMNKLRSVIETQFAVN